MSKVITVKNVTIGEGMPKICVSLTGRTISELIEEAQLLVTLDIDLVEWRVDFFEKVEDLVEVKKALETIRSILADLPLIFTFRSLKEGGEREVNSNYYRELNEEITKTGMVEFIDVELFQEETTVKFLVESAHSNQSLVIISNHDFKKTPSKDEIIARLMKAQELGADLPKIAVMPNNSMDVLTLLDASSTMNSKTPIITISMGGWGVISRISGEIFGSAITFAAGKKGSAPGQIGVNELRNVLKMIHSNF